MSGKSYTIAKGKLDPHKKADKSWYLSLLDGEAQQTYEQERLDALLVMLKLRYLLQDRKQIARLQEELGRTKRTEGYGAGEYRTVLELNAEIAALRKKSDTYKCYFTEPYFARMDVVDEKEGYNSYYIGKRGDINLEIVDWRAPLAVRYYQKSRVTFKINDYEYRTVLRRALSVKNGRLLSYKNEYLSVKDVLTPEEIAGRDEEILFDPYLRDIIRDRKDDVHVRDIIRTIQEKQFGIINLPERESFVLQGCAGSGKTMILLHRLSYLMYNNEALSPKDVLVLTPSDSFNAFIDELSEVLELKRVYTVTLKKYFLHVLKNEGVDLAEKLTERREEEGYLRYLYSADFPRDVKREIGKLYDSVIGLFASEECRGVAEELLLDCAARNAEYAKLKNASVRVRRCVLGEMKENREGKFYFTKPMRGLMSAFSQTEEFLRFALGGEILSADRFFRRFSEFYRSAREVFLHAEKIFDGAADDLKALSEALDREIADLKRYRMKTPSGEQLTYADRIARRQTLKEETESAMRAVGNMRGGIELFGEFFRILQSSELCAELGKCETGVDIARFYYRRTVKQYKKKFGMNGLFPSDAYAMCQTLAQAGRQLTPRYGLVFIDEGQDISASEYELLERINSDAAFNVFGDLKQNVTPWRGVGDWSRFGNLYELNRNYRNTNEIVEYVRKISGVDMTSIGLSGEAVVSLPVRKVGGFFRGKQGLKAVIAREEYLPLFSGRGYSLLSGTGTLSRSKINVMTVFESKGLEFSSVAVYGKDMTENEMYIACTRALKELALVAD